METKPSRPSPRNSCTFQLSSFAPLLHRNHGMGDTSIKFEVIPGKNQKSEYVMTCGKHTVRGWCELTLVHTHTHTRQDPTRQMCHLCCVCVSTGKNKRVGKQLASQKILQMLHPHVKNWGSLLRMYGRESNKMVKKVPPKSNTTTVVSDHFVCLSFTLTFPTCDVTCRRSRTRA